MQPLAIIEALGRLRGAAGAIASGHLTLVARATGEALHIRYVADLTDAANPHLRLTFRAAGKQQEQVISLDATKPRYGGARYWFLCPVTGERVRCLYLTRDVDAFASRAVHGLSYRSQSENAFWRGVRHAQKIRTLLGGDPSIYSPFPPRPRGMRKQRYERLKREATALEVPAIVKLTPSSHRG